MSAKFELNLGKTFNIYKQNAKNIINESLIDLYKEILINSPKDTGEFKNSNKIFEATEFGDTIKGSVLNTDDKAVNVEFGFRSTPVNWHKYKGGPVIYKGVGARTYTRSFDKKEQEIRKKFKGIKIK